MSDFIDAEDGYAYCSTDTDAKQDLRRCWPLAVGADGLDLSGSELLAGELTNTIDENRYGFVEALIA